MDLIVDKSKTVCFTGHRPDKLPDNGDPRSQTILVLKSLLRQEIIDAVNDGYDTFISGMAAGVDMWAAEIVEELMDNNRYLQLYGAYPFRNYDSRYKTTEEEQLTQRIVSRASGIVYVSENYFKGCMFERNRFMADRSSRMIAVVGDYKTGTGYTVRYAKKLGVDVHILDINRLFPQMENLSFF
ncbi:MAG: SLOG family protein [Oscillospiraceae bacterium]|nr:SLOG family protein [Oscillospiraceae bacterium]